MKIGIIGTGAMASLFAARLSNNSQVVMIGSWRDQIDAINRNGLVVIELDKSRSHHRFVATDTPALAAPVDIALVLTKSYQTIEAVERVKAVLSDDGAVVTLQNGLGNLAHFEAEFGRSRTTAGVTTLGATLIQPGLLQHAGDGSVHLAISQKSSPFINAFATLLELADFHVNLIDNATTLLWSKVIINAAINPLTALFNIPNGALTSDPGLRTLMIAMALEAKAVADALNVTLTYEDVSTEVQRVAEATAINRSSMLQDVTRGTPTEIDAICGEIIRIAQLNNIPTPLNVALKQAIIARESSQPPFITVEQLQTLVKPLQ